jgi:hypothetical protein
MTTSVPAQWHSTWKPAFDEIVTGAPSPANAVELVRKFGAPKQLPIPRYYVSTAISSAGWRRDPELQDPANIGTAIERNNATASRILAPLVANSESLVNGDTMMVPTDLGKVRGWKDTDYLVFYFAWLSGLTAPGAAAFAQSFRDPVYQPVIDTADDRSITDNERRWPSYQAFVEIALTKLRIVESQRRFKDSEGSEILLQLVDVSLSLGCRAERLFADARGLDVIIPTFTDQLPGELGSDVQRLTELGAQVGAPRHQVELIPVVLR